MTGLEFTLQQKLADDNKRNWGKGVGCTPVRMRAEGPLCQVEMVTWVSVRVSRTEPACFTKTFTHKRVILSSNMLSPFLANSIIFKSPAPFFKWKRAFWNVTNAKENKKGRARNLSLPLFFFNLPGRWDEAAGARQSRGAGLPPQECGLSQMCVPLPLASFCHSKLLIVGEVERERLQTAVCCEKQAFFLVETSPKASKSQEFIFLMIKI